MTTPPAGEPTDSGAAGPEHPAAAGHDHQHDHSHRDSHSHAHDPGPLADASVRRAGPNDAAAVGLVQEAVWQQTYAPRVPAHIAEQFSASAFASVWRKSLAAPPPGVWTLLVACAGAQVVGYAVVGPSQDPDGEPSTGALLEIGVHPQGRRSGHGSRLLNAAADILREAGATELTAWLPADAEETRAFFDQAGLGPDGAFRDRVITEDAHVRETRVSARLVDEA
ncbi:MAG: GNAT family N-acetyltransferase [Actinomycetia bacterium]|nr:GNAT family N-acetyltransferase [Actinomycetes bacterium]